MVRFLLLALRGLQVAKWPKACASNLPPARFQTYYRLLTASMAKWFNRALSRYSLSERLGFIRSPRSGGFYRPDKPVYGSLSDNVCLLVEVNLSFFKKFWDRNRKLFYCNFSCHDNLWYLQSKMYTVAGNSQICPKQQKSWIVRTV